MIRVINRWCGPLTADFGPPLGKVRIPKAGVELDVEFNDLQLPKQTLAMVGRKTIEIVDGELPVEEPADNGQEPGGAPPVDTKPAPKPSEQPKPEPLADERIAELRALAAGDKRSPTVRKAIEILEEAGVPLEEPKGA